MRLARFVARLKYLNTDAWHQLFQLFQHTVDFVLNIKRTFGSYKMDQIAIQSRGHFRVAVKGTYCLCLNILDFRKKGLI